MKAFRFACGVLLVLFVVSCSVQQSWVMIGKWQKVDGKDTVEFMRDGTVTVVSGPTTIKTTFRMNDPKKLEIALGNFGSIPLQVAVEKDILTLTDAKGQALKYKKVIEAPPQKNVSPQAPQKK